MRHSRMASLLSQDLVLPLCLVLIPTIVEFKERGAKGYLEINDRGAVVTVAPFSTRIGAPRFW